MRPAVVRVAVKVVRTDAVVAVVVQKGVAKVAVVVAAEAHAQTVRRRQRASVSTVKANP
jgi:hypothetical protein